MNNMNKEGLYRTVEQAIKQYYSETGVLIDEIHVTDAVNVSTQDKRDILISLSTTEHQTTAQ